jgi:hypothetical protein
MYHMAYISTWLGRFTFMTNSSLKNFLKKFRTNFLLGGKVLAEFGPQLGRPNVDTLNEGA